MFSAVSIREIAFKAGFGRADLQIRPELILSAATEAGMTEPAVTAELAAMVADPPTQTSILLG